MTQPITDWPTVPTDYPVVVKTPLELEIEELRVFKEQWEPVLIQMVPALVSIVKLATGMMPPAMQGMIPPQVKAFVDSVE